PAPGPVRRGRGPVAVSELVIMAPMRVEAAIVASGARGATVRKTGMGPRRALAAAGGLAGEAPDALLVLGFCGGLDETSVPGEVIVADEVYAAEDEAHPAKRVSCDCSAELLTRVAGQGLKVRS